MSIHEVVDRMLHHAGHLWFSGDKFKFVPTVRPQFRTRTLRPITQLEKDGCFDPFYPHLVTDFYPNRPQFLDNISLFDFARCYKKIDKKQAGRNSNSIVIKRDNTILGYFLPVPENDRPVIMHHEFSLEQRSEDFFYSLLLLHKPWRQEEDISSFHGHEKPFEQEFYYCFSDYPMLKKYFDRKKLIQKRRQDMEAKVDERIDQMDREIIEDVIDPGVGVYDDHSLPERLQIFESMNKECFIKDQHDLDHRVAMLNSDQLSTYNMVTQHLSHVLKHSTRQQTCEIETCRSVKPLLLFCSGPAGTGETFLLDAIVGFMHVQRSVYGRKCDSIICAPSGLAASNVKGTTIHSVFKIPVYHDSQGKYPPYQSLSKPEIDATRAVMQNLQCLIIDEISMTSNALLFAIHMRLSELFKRNQAFGGLPCVIVFGDLLQLPPVEADPPYTIISKENIKKMTSGSKHSLHLWKDFKFNELTINQRQAGEGNEEWRGILSRLRLGVVTTHDLQHLNSRLIPISSKASTPDEKLNSVLDFLDSLQRKCTGRVTCLFPTRRMTERFNSAYLTRHFPNAVRIPAIDFVDCAFPAKQKQAEEAVFKIEKLSDPRHTGGLEKNLHLSVGVGVMLLQNKNVSQGLVNGSMGTIVRIEEGASNVVRAIHIKFDGITDEIVMLREKRKIQLFPGAFLHREQFPVILNTAITIHKSQGLSLETVLVDLGDSVFSPNQSYVALSRVTTIDGLYLINFSPHQVTADKRATNEYTRLGSKCVAGAISKRSAGTRRRYPEVIWYIHPNAIKARHFLENMVAEELAAVSSRQPTPVHVTFVPENLNKVHSPLIEIKASIKKYTTVHYGVTYIDINKIFSKQQNIDEVRRLVRVSGLGTEEVDSFLTRLDDQQLHFLFDGIILPYGSNFNRIGQTREQLAIYLHPDPFACLNSNPKQKWLTGELMDYFGVYLRETTANLNIYYLACAARRSYVAFRYDMIRHYVGETHHVRQWSLTRNPDDPFSIVDEIKAAGDPFAADVIFSFCNDNDDHWYLLIVDLRLQPNKVILLDSMNPSRNVFLERCEFILTYLNEFRREILTSFEAATPQWNLDVPDFNPSVFDFKHGSSVQQKNSFDCGVYSCLNIESFINATTNDSYLERTLPFLRLKIMFDIHNFLRMSNCPMVERDTGRFV